MSFIRAFFAVPLPEEVKNKITDVSKRLKTLCPTLSLTSSNNLHITLLFLGSVKEKIIKRIINDISPYRFLHQLNIRNIGYFGSQLNPRVVWIGCSPEENLVKLNAFLSLEVKKLGAIPDDKEFHPHTTIARIKGQIVQESFSKFISESSMLNLGEVAINKFILYKSDLTSQGPIHTILKEYNSA
ncbi:MAG: RNA 2',3'-cyclic phosphodiesterase [Planctomycetes bacterium]|nr:RNA 2',3'-cyclic phosphodiesterase [Planctomycetota bacterium]